MGTPVAASATLRQALALHERGQLAQAQDLYIQVLRARPDDYDALHLLGVIACQLNDPARSLRLIDQAIALNPNDSRSHYNRGLAQKTLGQIPEAILSFQRAAVIAPGFAQAFFEQGLLQVELGQLQPALASYSHAVRLNPDYAEAHYNRALVYRTLQLFDAALSSYDLAVAARRDYARAYAGRGTVRLLCGDYPRGWADYEWRWRDESSAQERRAFAVPLWLGKEPLQGRRILLHSEQGMGDTLQFCRYARLVHGLGAEVILEAPGPLLGLLRSLDGVSQLVGQGQSLPPVDYHCPLMSLPLAFATTVASVPAEVPYLRAERDKVEFWRAALTSDAHLKVGLVWAGGFRPNHPEARAIDARRNIELHKLAALAHPGIRFYSLQKGQRAEAQLTALLAQGGETFRPVDLAASLATFADTAAVIENLDLVISVDTSTAHLVGALAKPVWIMNRFDACWRWLRDRTDSPWYPSARLYRQESLGNWDGPIQRIKADLAQLADTGVTG